MACFQTKNANLGKFLEGLRKENVDIFYGHLEYFINVWDFFGHLEYYFQFWHHVPRKIWHPWSESGGEFYKRDFRA
jgi:hypothetical protein